MLNLFIQNTKMDKQLLPEHMQTHTCVNKMHITVSMPIQKHIHIQFFFCFQQIADYMYVCLSEKFLLHVDVVKKRKQKIKSFFFFEITHVTSYSDRKLPIFLKVLIYAAFIKPS